MTIKDVAKQKQEKFQERYIRFKEENPGYIMSTDAIRIEACSEVIEKYSTIEELEEQIKINLEKYKTILTPNGFYIYADTFKEIIDEYKVKILK